MQERDTEQAWECKAERNAEHALPSPLLFVVRAPSSCFCWVEKVGGAGSSRHQVVCFPRAVDVAVLARASTIFYFHRFRKSCLIDPNPTCGEAGETASELPELRGKH